MWSAVVSAAFPSLERKKKESKAAETAALQRAPRPFCYSLLLPHGVDLQDLVAIVVDDLHGDLALLRRVEGDAPGSVQLRLFRLVDLGPQHALQLLVGLLSAEEVGVADEEALVVVVRVDEPAGDVVGAARTNLAGGRVEHIDAAHRDDQLAVLLLVDGNVRLAEDH